MKSLFLMIVINKWYSFTFMEIQNHHIVTNLFLLLIKKIISNISLRKLLTTFNNIFKY